MYFSRLYNMLFDDILNTANDICNIFFSKCSTFFSSEFFRPPLQLTILIGTSKGNLQYLSEPVRATYNTYRTSKGNLQYLS